MKSFKQIREALEIGTKEIVDAYKKATPGETNETKVECPQCKGEGCDHCEGKGYHLEEKYRPPTQAEIDADKKKDRKAQRAAGKRRPSMSTKSIGKKMYGNMRGGLKEEDLQELDAKMQKKFAAGAKNMKAYAQKNGGVDKKDFMDVAKLLDQIARVNLLQAGQLLSRLNRLVDGMDTDVRERIYIELQKVGLVEELEEKKAPKIDDKKYAAHMARNKKPAKQSSTKKSLSDIQKRANEEVDERKLTPKEIKKALASAKAKAKPKSKVSLKKAPFEIPESLSEKLQVSDGMAKWIEDFQASDAPQFKDKDKNERREMAIAAYLAAKRRGKKED
jgi:hypothetical protein